MSAADELAALDAEHQRLIRHRRQIDVDERAAWDRVHEAEAALTVLERELLTGDPPPQQQVRAAEKALRSAREGADVEWPSKQKAADAAVREAYAARYGFIETRFDDLISEVHERADLAAAEVDDAGRTLLAALHRRAAIDAEVTGLVHVGRPGDEQRVRRTRTDALRAEAERLLATGEAAPKYEPLRPAIAVGEAS